MKPTTASAYGNQNACCWHGCFQPAERDNVPLCEGHFRQAGLAWLADNIELVREVAGIAEFDVMMDRARREAAERLPAMRERDAEERALREAGSIVYYVRTHDRIKIGYTTDLRTRLINLRVDRSAVLATEPGGRDVEFRRHHEFADERYGRREDFAPSDRLVAHVNRLRRERDPSAPLVTF